MTRRGRRIAAAALATIALPGCAAANAPHGNRPTEVDTREAYFGTPLVFDDQVIALEIGTPRAVVERRLAPARITYTRPRSPQLRSCVAYPIFSTQRWDAFGSPEADEWELCYDAADRLATRRKLLLTHDR